MQLGKATASNQLELCFESSHCQVSTMLSLNLWGHSNFNWRADSLREYICHARGSTDAHAGMEGHQFSPAHAGQSFRLCHVWHLILLRCHWRSHPRQ